LEYKIYTEFITIFLSSYYLKKCFVQVFKNGQYFIQAGQYLLAVGGLAFSFKPLASCSWLLAVSDSLLANSL